MTRQVGNPTMPHPSGDTTPVCVDLDGTLVRSDLLVESYFALLKAQPMVALRAPFWLLKGKAFLKQQIAARVELDASSLPYDRRLVEWVRERREQGAFTALCTASDRRLAMAVSEHLGIFDDIVASDGDRNLSGTRKRDALVARFGERGFDYAGNEAVDLPIWAQARRAVVVNAPRDVAERVRAQGNLAVQFERERSGFRAVVKSLRLHQWLKNVLVFVPMFAAHRGGEAQLVTQALLAFVAFGLCASSVYLVNDLLDLPSDRRHPTKRRRPLAAGDMPIAWALAIAPALLAASLAIALLALPWRFLAVLVAYFALTLAYSLRLKQLAVVDILVLAGLYTARIVAGGAAVGVSLSFWLLALSMFLFLSLAAVKRYAEMLDVGRKGGDKAGGRGYVVSDLALIQSLGVAAGYLSVLVLALYINSPESRDLYRHVEFIWLLCPLLLFWVSRVWLKTHRGEMHEDPVIFAARDKLSLGIAVVGAAIVAAAT